MRRVLAICLAILVVTIAARGAMAQDSEQTVSDRLLEILKDRQIISTDEYGELKTLAASMQDDRTEVNRRLTDLDRSIADYMAKSGDAMGANVSYTKGMGFGFKTGDGFFALNLGGLFQFVYTGYDNDDARDTNNFDVEENRLILQGYAFDPNLAYYVEFDADGSVTLLDAYIDYNVCDWSMIRAGNFKLPYGRQNLTHESDRAFADRGPVAAAFNLDRDVGLMFHDVLNVQEGGDAAFEYAVGIWNGEGRNSSMNDNNWMAWGGRMGIHPFGAVPYVEGDWTGADEPKFALAGSYFSHKNAMDTDFTAWEIDGVLTWANFFLLAEYFENEMDPEGSGSADNDGWYVQGGYMVVPGQVEIIARYGQVDFDEYYGLDEMKEWSVGVVYYVDGHHLKMGANVGKSDTDVYVIEEEPEFYPEKSCTEGIDTLYIRIWFQLEW
jgi:hypothetical protein